MDDLEFLKKLADCNDKEQMARCIENHKPMTNAEKIRAMSDEALAEVLYAINAGDVCLNPTYTLCGDGGCPFNSFCNYCKQGRELAWLQQPAEEVHHE
jgi:hypothetical protein